jgi:hypothetical protein
VYDIVAQMLSNQDTLESKFRDLDLRIMALQVTEFSFIIYEKSLFFLVTNGKFTKFNGIDS